MNILVCFVAYENVVLLRMKTLYCTVLLGYMFGLIIYYIGTSGTIRKSPFFHRWGIPRS